jgi:5S rRNA maturation endonuclease (ribonuclease M5)
LKENSQLDTTRDNGKAEKAAESKKRRASRIKKNLTDEERDLVELLSSIDKKYENLIIVVEGRLDEHAIREFGIKSRIVRTQSSLGRAELIDRIVTIAGKRGQVLILTDFDREGSHSSGFIERELELRKVKVLKGLRLKIRTHMGDRRCIEDLGALSKREDSAEMTG